MVWPKASSQAGGDRHLDTSYKAARVELFKDVDVFQWWFLPQAERFVREQLEAAGGRGRTLRTLGGAFGFLKVSGAIRKTDDQAFLAWANTNAPALVRETIKHDVPAGRLKGHWLATGEIRPGCEVVPEHDAFSHRIEKNGSTEARSEK